MEISVRMHWTQILVAVALIVYWGAFVVIMMVVFYMILALKKK